MLRGRRRHSRMPANSRSPSAVHLWVLHKVGGLAGCAAALAARVWPHVCVHPPVLGEERTLPEAFAAVVSRVGFLGCGYFGA